VDSWISTEGRDILNRTLLADPLMGDFEVVKLSGVR
jgi:hypothetical protein